jgi:hypothetical protein
VAKTLGLSAESFGNLQTAVNEHINGKGKLNDTVTGLRDTVWSSVYDEGGIDDASEDAQTAI